MMDITVEKKKTKVKTKKHFKTFALAFFVSLVTLFAGAFSFTYIEHCNNVEVPKRKNCGGLRTFSDKIRINNSSLLGTKNTVHTLKDLCTSTNASELEVELRMRNQTTTDGQTKIYIQDLCLEEWGSKESVLECLFDMKTIFKWVRFCMSVGFTTGYGRVVPFSDAGKITTIFYALVFIPMVAATLVYCSRFCIDLYKLLIFVVEEHVMHRKQIFNFNRKIMILETISLIIVLNIYVAIARTKIVDFEEKPTSSFTDAYYYAVVSMTTIGFGDFDYSEEFYTELEESMELSILHFFHEVVYLLLMALGATFINGLTSLEKDKEIEAKTEERTRDREEEEGKLKEKNEKNISLARISQVHQRKNSTFQLRQNDVA